ncbi:MAG: peptide ABC transporter substrate-binding protein, partial [Chloroflexota bacterium]|nr:peptide ABC transporter substrate-binding protein [Chloroflexota bacterium]
LWGTDVAGMAGELIYDKLVKLGSDGEFIPDLAKQVPTTENGGVSSDGLTYTFQLRGDVKFQDGVTLTCKDVKFTWDTALDPKTHTKDRQIWTSAASGGVECKDEHTVVFHLKQPINNMLEIAALYGILPQHLLAGKDINTDPFNQKPIGTGPFKLTDWVKGDHLTFVKNPAYFQGAPNLDGVVIRYMPDANALLAATHTGELDVRLGVSAAQLEAASQLKAYDLVSIPIQSIFNMYLNWQKPGLSDPDVRLALAHAIDKEGISKTILKGTATSVDVPVPPQSWAYSSPPRIAYDPALAKKMLDQAGWKPEPDGVRTKGGQRLKFTILTIPEFERLKVLQVVVQQWKAIGVQADLSTADLATWAHRVSQGDFDVAYGFYSYTYSVDNRPLLACDRKVGNRNYGHWCVAALDKLMADAAATPDQPARKALFAQFQRQFEQSMPIIPMFARSEVDSMSKKFHAFKPNPYQSQGISDFWNAWQWWKE